MLLSEIRTFPDLESLSAAAADEIIAIARVSIEARGRFTILLAGGGTPRRTYEVIAERHRDAIDWGHVVVTFGDERYVPHSDPRSNYGMARDALLAHVAVPAERVLAVPTELPSAEEAAGAYERMLRRELAQASGVDLALLGVGADGHTASLFPGSPVLGERARWVRAVDAPAGVEPRWRLTTTLPFLNGARVAMFLVAGGEKRDVVDAILAGGAEAQRYPAALIAPRERLLWMLDAEVTPPARARRTPPR